MKPTGPRGQVYRCPVCGAEVAVLARRVGDYFRPRCCNRDIELLPGRLKFYLCPACGAEVTVLRPGKGDFRPRCCNTEMVPEAA